MDIVYKVWELRICKVVLMGKSLLKSRDIK